MNNKFPELKLAEERRYNFHILAFGVSFLSALGIWFLFQTKIGIVVSVATFSILLWRLSSLIYAKIKVPCPICGSDNLNENYANAPRHASANIAHKCKDCGSSFLDGELVGGEDT